MKYLIHLRRIWNPSIAPYWRSYSGSNPHEKHGHVSIVSAFEDDVSDWFGESGEIMAGEADRIIATIGSYEQDTRRLFVELLERMGTAARKIEGKRTRRLEGRLDRVEELLEALVAGRKPGKAPELEPAEEELESVEEAGARYLAEIEGLAGDLDERIAAKSTAGELPNREDVDQFVAGYRSDLSRLAGGNG